MKRGRDQQMYPLPSICQGLLRACSAEVKLGATIGVCRPQEPMSKPNVREWISLEAKAWFGCCEMNCAKCEVVGVNAPCAWEREG